MMRHNQPEKARLIRKRCMASNTEQLLPYLAVGDCIVYRHNLTQQMYCVVTCQKAKKKFHVFSKVKFST